MDLSRLGRGERFALIASAALLVLSLIPLWAKVEAGPFTERATAWDFGLAVKLALLIAILVLVLGGLRAAGSNVALPLPPGQLYLAAGAVMALLLLIQVIAGVPGAEIGGALGVDVTRGPLLLISPLIAAAVAYGGYIDRAEGAGTPASPTPPGPPL